jgi:endo-1,4-beta-xylanase
MTTRHPVRIIAVAIIVSIAAMGCGKSAGLATGAGGTSDGGSMTATGGSGQGGSASGGTPSAGGQIAAGGTPGSGGRNGTGGSPDAGASSSAGGVVGSGAAVAATGGIGAGGTNAAGGTVSRDGGFADVPAGTGGTGAGGTLGTGGARGGTSGTVGSGGSLGTGGVATGGTSTGTSIVTIDCNAALPSNGVLHTGNTQGTLGSLAWTLWSNGAGATMTTFDRPAFRLTWGPDSGDALGRFGLDFGDSGLTFDQYGPITAQFSESKSGTGGSYSYIGVYGLTTDPCVEFYIVDDSYMAMPFKAWASTNKGSVTIDGDSYALYSGIQSATDTSSCRGSGWYLFYSIRQTARSCGQISVTQHFDAWKAAGMRLGNLVQVHVLAEVGGGTGSIDFPVASVTIGP